MEYLTMRGKTYDIHLSAQKISADTVRKIENLGLVRDQFANNTRCVASEYHGTYRGDRKLPDNGLWRELCDVLAEDSAFGGCLEEESINSKDVRMLNGQGQKMPDIHANIPIRNVPAGKHKACDIHVGINLDKSAISAIDFMERLEIASFDKPLHPGTRRVYTLTCETADLGRRMFDGMHQILQRVPGLLGKIKLEFTTRFLRVPNDSPTLPLTDDESALAWLSKQQL